MTCPVPSIRQQRKSDPGPAPPPPGTGTRASADGGHLLETPWLSEVRPVTRREPPPSGKGDPYRWYW
jgi:hypothetical protein